MQLSYKEVTKEDDVVRMIFRHRESVKAAKTFIDWLRSLGGTCTHSQMNKFSKMLASGELGCKLSRTNFYGTILSRFLDLGLLEERLRYDYEKRKAVKVYGVIYQPVTKRRPTSPSLLFIAHVICEKWNQEFFS